MPKSLVLGNGNILVGLDSFGQVRDFYFPYVGLENHVGGHFVHRIGAWVDGIFHWISDGSWQITIDCDCEAFLGSMIARNEDLGIELRFVDSVYNERNILVRRVQVKNLRGDGRQVRLYFAHEFEIYESHRGDTVYFDPIHHAIVHYKGRRVFLINARMNAQPFDDYAVGVFRIEGKEGTFRDAEDGMLSKNPVEHGPTDSVLGISMTLKKDEERTVHYWVAAAESVHDAEDLNDYVLKKGPEHLIQTTTDFWHAWVTKYKFNFHGLSEAVEKLFNKSLFVVRAHADNNGAIIASSDSDMYQVGKDTYGYMWPRDAAFAASALDKAGDPNVARRFFEFSRDVVTHDGYFMHKYRPDKSLGSSWHPWIHEGKVQLPIQEDETALVLWALWQHYQSSRDLEFVEAVYHELVEKTANFLLGYRDFKTGLPKPSYDLWEERLGIHTFTAASVYGGLVAAAHFAKLLGKTRMENNYLHAAHEIRDAIMRNLYDSETGLFHRMVTVKDGKIIPDSTLDASSVYGIHAFGVLEASDPRLIRAMHATREKLTLKTPVGGVARYMGDTYYRSDSSVPGNPWIITTLWFADYDIDMAKSEAELAPVKAVLEWVATQASPSGILSEQLDPHTGAHVSVSPLTWSHAQFVLTLLKYLNKLEEFGVCVACNPVQ